MSTPQTRLSPPATGHIDVLLAGAGISGIGAGYHLKTRPPGTTLLILHAREGIGGTWDLFRYPGVRSDSDLPTFAHQFKPWTRDNGRFWINGQAVGLGEDGEADGWLSAYEDRTGHVRPAPSPAPATWSPTRRARTEGTAGD
jgi:cation diffusion facilitator CzcD-associated flavoprotein CzcO